MTSLRRSVYLAAVAGLWLGCSLDRSGLLGDAGAVPTDAPATTGAAGTSGAGGRGGGSSAGTGGGAAGGAGAGAGGTSAGQGGVAGVGSGGAEAGTGGLGAAGAGGSGAADASAGGAGGGAGSESSGAGGVAGADAGSDAAAGGGGAGGTGLGGRGGEGGLGGRGGAGGAGGAGGRGGASGRGGGGGRGGSPACAGYPRGAVELVTPNDGRVHCYWAHAEAATWGDAQAACRSESGHLVTILSDMENQFVVSIAAFSPSFSDAWIGATDGKAGGDQTGPGTYRWVTDEPWGWSAWAPNQPDGFCDPCSGGQQCTCDHRAVLGSDGTWNDRWSENERGFVCEATPP